MTELTTNQEVQGTSQLMKSLEQDLASLINDESNGLSDLASFTKNLTKSKSEKQLTKHNLRLIKEDLQDRWLVDFEAGNKNWKQFGFEVIGNDIEPTLTPNWDCLIPINFRYDSQRRTKLLILHIEDENWANVYSIPNWDNEYKIEIWRENWVYELKQDALWFHLVIK